MKKVPTSITVEEAVAYMVNMDYIPEGFTLLEMLEAFSEEADVEYENSPGDWTLTNRKDACISRYNLAELLLQSLQHEVEHPEDSMIVLSDETSSKQRLTFESVADWAADRYGIGISLAPIDTTVNKFGWENVTIKIWKDYNIGYSSKKGKYKRSHFREIGLMGIKKNVPNKLGGILIGLSQNKNFPTGKHPIHAEKTAISKLGRDLRKWVGLSEGPFHTLDPSDGWKPKFKLIYDVDNADKRAKEKAEKTMVSLDDPKRKKKLYDSGVYPINDNVDDDSDDFDDSIDDPEAYPFE